MGTRTQVVVVGGGITGLACAHRLHGAGVDVLLLEAGDRVGGKIRTLAADGYQFEAGPNTLIANKRAMLDLLSEAGLNDQIIDGSPAAKRRWITLNGRLCPLPSGPGSALASPLLGPRAMIRAASDLWRGRGAGTPGDESVASFVTRRFGTTIARNLVAPFLTGVYAGDADRLEARSVLGALVEAEEASGSVIRGLIAAAKARKARREAKLPMRSITLREGLEALPRRLAQILGARVRTSASVAETSAEGDGVTVTLASGESILADHLVVTTGARDAARLIAGFDGSAPIAAALGAIPHAGLAMVGLAYDTADVPHPLDGFGYLNGPGSEGPVLGCLFKSSVFPGVAPAGKALLVAFIGGARHPGWGERPEGDVVAAARAELRERLAITARPRREFVFRWPIAVPQYNRGHAAVRAAVQAWCASRPVSVVGSVLTGVSLNDCVDAARAEADRLAARLRPRRAGAPDPSTEPREAACA